MIEIDLPFPPSSNHLYAQVGRRRILSRQGRRYRQAVCEALAGMGMPRLDGQLAVAVEVFPPDERRRDLDNLQKCLFDSLQEGGLYKDDSQIARISIVKRSQVAGGAIIVRVEEMP